VDECKPLGGGGGAVEYVRSRFGGGGGGERGDAPRLGRAVQLDPVNTMLKAPGIKRLKLKRDVPLSNFAFKFNLRRYTSAAAPRRAVIQVSNAKVGRCRLTANCPRPGRGWFQFLTLKHDE
jgi:hypothetical protein